ncbi:MAG: UDP-N-acetylmuramoyl-L-alanine--D-glutamate ligase [Oscillospiraceae bacterium]|nr:UDP-N-acetylmuramoyl-L-alanine--D-glutamate ligase [Oscillospiraceae bacterium]
MINISFNDRYTDLRQRHERLIYHDFFIEEGRFSFHFSIDDFHFKPEWNFRTPLTGDISLLVFNLGMAELISYWKSACPPIVEVRCGVLDEWQTEWWKKLYKNGLGEFFYRNGIKVTDDFMQIYTSGKSIPLPKKRSLHGCLIPVGGGKDSIVTLELLREQKESSVCYVVGNIESALNSAKTAEYPDSHIINVSRTIDPVLLELNRRGYLNGHTPFSSVVAFSSLIFAYLSGKKYIVLSNESSANEGNTADGVNHQYSKSTEFERDFRRYVSRIGAELPEYFSLLRPFGELRITEMFTRYPRYFPVFKSCNVGSKANIWCCKCAKCLYVYIMLAAWLDDETLIKIFGENLLENEGLSTMLTALASPDYDKPFECVGTRDEVNFSLYKALERRTHPPRLLRDYASEIKKADFNMLRSFDENNFLPDEFRELIRIFNMTELHNFFRNKKVLILGFGLEGRSTLKILKQLPCEIIIADKNAEAVKDLPYKTHVGEDYLNALYTCDYDIIMKSPGIPLLGIIPDAVKQKITSQTDLLLRFRKNTIVGITGTKGKSTVSSLVYYILKSCGKNTALIGNIGVPPLENEYDPETILVCEMSCHQLEYVKASPDVAVLLNIYEEHLDHYNSFEDYAATKENIFKYQREGDISIRGEDEDLHRFRAMIEPEKTKLRGEFNYNNIAVALKVTAIFGCDPEKALTAAQNFAALPHRLELFAEINGVEWVNDSISTIPRASILAVEAFPDTDTLIIGGMDRGINYDELIYFLQKVDKTQKHGIINLIALPDSGYKIADALTAEGLAVYRAKDLTDAVKHAAKVTKRRCILSPAAASYGFYKNFEERGEHFKSLVEILRE